MAKWLLTVAVVVIVLGLLTPALRRHLPGRRLPGDVTLRWRGRDYFFPFATTLLLSLLFVAISRLF
ncbi:DUF2905 domain-containing protein [Azospira restricta]|uniref:DUF2905 domain-containing protein n=1 Tax=Azospira restricta TaxID=404405 RepID=A0A974SQ33_9RHOO|nr:DUF2905 domain-containing protein [Azospira restricta]QRJ64319.1 DUF2905 domain-containing protein [Azospira restricta]